MPSAKKPKAQKPVKNGSPLLLGFGDSTFWWSMTTAWCGVSGVSSVQWPVPRMPFTSMRQSIPTRSATHPVSGTPRFI